MSVARIFSESSLKLKGDNSDGEYRGSLRGLGRPGVEIRGLFPLLSILDIFTLYPRQTEREIPLFSFSCLFF